MMLRLIDRILSLFLIGLLSFILLVELANLIGFGSQEIYLHHPDYPEGEQYKQDVQDGFIQLLIWTILTVGLLMGMVYSRIKMKGRLFNMIVIMILLLGFYIPLETMLHGFILNGMLIFLLILGLLGLTFLKMKKEKIAGYRL